MNSPLQAAVLPARPLLRLDLLCLSVSVLTGTFRIMAQSPWGDEIYMLVLASSGFLRGLQHHLTTNMLPFHPALLWVFTLGGRSLLGGRLLSVLAFSGAAVCLHLSARRLLGPRAALFAVAAFSLNPLMVWHAQDARPYMLLVSLCLASLYFLLRAMDGERRVLSALFASVLCGSLTHVYFTAFAAAVGLHLLVYRRAPGARRALFTLAAAGLSAAPAIVALTLLSGSVDAGYGKPVDLAAFAYAMLTFGTGYAFGPTTEELHRPDAMSLVWSYMPAIIPCLLTFWGAIAWGAASLFRKDRRLCLVLLGYALIPMVFPFAVALVRRTITFNVRYVLPALPVLTLFPAHAFAGANRRRTAATALLLTLPVEVYGLFSYYLDERYWKEDYAGVARFLTESAGPQDELFEGPAPRGMIFMLHGREVHALPSSAALESPLPAGRHAFYVVNRRWVSDPHQRLVPRLEEMPGVRRVRLRGFDVFIR